MTRASCHIAPTAVHALADTHDTPDSRSSDRRSGLGVVWIAQLLPSHRSANVAVARFVGSRCRRRCTRSPTRTTPHTARRRWRWWGWGWSGPPSSSRPTAPPTSRSRPLSWCRCRRRCTRSPTRTTPHTARRHGAVGLGVVWIAQLLPFHRSANDAGAAMLPSRYRRRCTRSPTRTTRHSARGTTGVGGGLDRPAPPVPPLRERHTGVLAVDVAADGGARARRHARHPRQLAGVATVGLGVVWIAQLVPSHRSANDPWLGTLLLVFSPTAVHALVDTQDTPDSWTKSAPAGLGVVGSPSSSRPTAPPTTR